ncbi:MAG: isocitrate/isopropylmalate dehydrogenase family protein [Candidatus Thermoplasmatota archaeon]|nr:isocitrate/isopropylmalate dehydrogenase family protein [Candidatus Thermoplasmatota archaeon]MBU1941891.1 isocitrate/isopropylmalate dehydrogenase family protein [Candidatus Thermoplasmatota archaeon]
MTKHHIAVLPGDGVGNDVMDAARIILDTINLDAEYIYGDIGWEFWKTEGNPLPDRTLKLLRETDCCLFGAITSKPNEDAQKELSPQLQNKGITYSSAIVRLRQEFNLHTNLRPCKAYPGNPLNYRDDIDLVVFRENTEGLYAGVEFGPPIPQTVIDALMTHKKMKKFSTTSPEDMAISCRIFTRKACQNIVTQAFNYAKDHDYPTVTLVEKPNVIRETSGMMVQEARKIAKNYPGIDLWEVNVDAMCMWLVKNPQDYGVLVSSNMFGDIISDLAAQIVGGLGFAASGNIGDNYAVFEPTHGSAPKYAGQYKVNPTAMIKSVMLMLDWLGYKKEAMRIDQAIAQVIKEGTVKTYDMGGTNTSLEVAEAIAKVYESL